MTANFTLNQFFKSNIPNAWCNYGFMKTYLRKSRHFINGEFLYCVDRASTVNPHRSNNVITLKQFKRTGKYKKLDDEIVRLAIEYNFDAVYVENVLNDFLPTVLLKMGYLELPQNYSGPPCFYKKFNV